MMSDITISSLPSQSRLTLIQKSRVVRTANELVKAGKSKDEAIAQAIGSVLIQKAADAAPATEEMVSYEVIYEPDVPDAHGQWMSKETLVKACEAYKQAQLTGAVTENLYHLQDTDAFTILDHWIQPEFDVTVAQTGEVIKAGTWVAKVKYNSEQLWEMKKANIVGGLSVQCGGMLNEDTGELKDLNFGIELEEDEE
jgi:hypothetical protein